MHLDADEVLVGLVLGGPEQLLAVAEADLEHQRSAAAERALRIQRAGLDGQAVARPVLGEGALLRRSESTLAQDEAADVPLFFRWREPLFPLSRVRERAGVRGTL